MLTVGNISEHVKIDDAFTDASLASTAGTGAYHSLAEHSKALFTFKAGAMANAATVVGQVMEAQDAAGTGAQVLTGAASTITATVKATRANLAGNTIADGDTVVTVAAVDEDGNSESYVFTCKDTTPDIDAGEYASGANDTAACVELAAAINHLLGHKLLATASTTNVIITSREPGKYTITLSGADATIVPSVLAAVGYVEVKNTDLSDGFTHVALRLTTTATIRVNAQLTRHGGRFGHKQAVAAAKVQ